MADNIEKEFPERSDLEMIADLLIRHSVEFLVVGGQAEVLMGSPRVTYDTDLCYLRTDENLQRLASALNDIKPTLRGAPADVPVVLAIQALRGEV